MFVACGFICMFTMVGCVFLFFFQEINDHAADVGLFF